MAKKNKVNSKVNKIIKKKPSRIIKKKTVNVVKVKKKNDRLIKVTNVDYPHFRLYLKTMHPALILDEYEEYSKKNNKNEKYYLFRKVTHSEKENGRNNEKVFPNPNPKDKKPMYIVKRKRHGLKKYFSKWKYPWNYPKR